VDGVSRTQAIAAVVAAVVVVALGVRWVQGQGAAAEGGARAGGGAVAGNVRVERPAAPRPLVHVSGAVRRPGVYRLRADARVRDAVGRAGGATGAGDANAINLAAKVADGQQIVVPRRAPAVGAAAGGGAAAAGAQGGAAAAAAPRAGGGPPVSLSTATAEQLDTLDGVGPATAQKILAYRQQHGGFRSVDELAQVPGIGPRRLAALRERVQP